MTECFGVHRREGSHEQLLTPVHHLSNLRRSGRFSPEEDLSDVAGMSLAHSPSCHRFGSITSKLLPAERAISQSSGSGC